MRAWLLRLTGRLLLRMQPPGLALRWLRCGPGSPAWSRCVGCGMLGKLFVLAAEVFAVEHIGRCLGRGARAHAPAHHLPSQSCAGAAHA